VVASGFDQFNVQLLRTYNDSHQGIEVTAPSAELVPFRTVKSGWRRDALSMRVPFSNVVDCAVSRPPSEPRDFGMAIRLTAEEVLRAAVFRHWLGCYKNLNVLAPPLSEKNSAAFMLPEMPLTVLRENLQHGR
jgi:hypothetical protein